MNLGLQHESFCVYEQVALSSLHLLAAIVTTLFSTYSGRLDRLAIDYAGTGLRVSLEANPHPLTQGLVHPLPSTIQAELSEVVIDAAPRWEIVRQQAPGAAAPHDIEDAVKDLT